MTFNKLFTSITESTVWGESDGVRLVWITMLAMADRHGRVWASLPGLARRARVDLEETKLAISKFLSPDPYSRTPEHEGRRVEMIDGGWRLLNHGKYRGIRDEEAIKESKRNYINKRRLAERVAASVENVERCRANAEAESEADPDPIKHIHADKSVTLGNADVTLCNAPKRYVSGLNDIEEKLAARIRLWFKRRESTPWNPKEVTKLKEMAKAIHEDDFKLLDAWYSAEIAEPSYRRKDVATLLNNWAGEVDRAKQWGKETEDEKRKRNTKGIRNLNTLNATADSSAWSKKADAGGVIRGRQQPNLTGCTEVGPAVQPRPEPQ